MPFGQIHIQLRGPLSVTDADERNLAPRSKKASAVLALLAEPADMRRNRRWLEDKLWSDRAPEQAQASLRTTLSDIRKSFGAASEILCANRDAVWLDRSAITTDLADDGTGREFLEGLDIADPEFDHWLSEMRIKYGQFTPQQAPLKTNRKISIQCATQSIDRASSHPLAQVISDRIGSTVSEFVANSKCTASGEDVDLVVDCTVDNSDAGAMLNVRVIDRERDEVLYSDLTTCDNLIDWFRDPQAFGRFSWNVADTALERLQHARRDESEAAFRAGFAQRALTDVLSFDPLRMQRSLATLDDGLQHMQAGIFLALRAWSAVSLIMEDLLDETPETLETIALNLRQAETLAPNNAMVMAMSASARATLLGDHQTAASLAGQVLRHNPTNLIALQAVSVAHAARGNYEEAYTHSALALSIAPPSKFEARSHLHHALLCLQLGKTTEALLHSKAASNCNPLYRAPRRQLIALHALAGHAEESRLEIEALKSLEKGFSLERYLYDDTYHTHTLRSSGHLKQALPLLSDLL